MEIRAKFWVEKKGEVVLGGGKATLLLAVERFGSIQGAADEFGMSYRHAWGIIKKIEKRAGFKLVETRKGGRDGKGACLTSQGKAFVEKVDSILKQLQEIVETKFEQEFRDRSLKKRT